jgi:hypothetical protein
MRFKQVEKVHGVHQVGFLSNPNNDRLKPNTDNTASAESIRPRHEKQSPSCFYQLF